MCDAVEGRFLGEGDVAGLVAAAEQARRDGIDVVFLTDGVLGDAIVLAAGLTAALEVAPARSAAGVLVGVRVGLGSQPHRHPTVLAREMTTLDLVSGGRTILAFTEPFSDATAEAITLCKEMWSAGIASSDGPHYPAAGAINRPLPARPGGPPIALDLTTGPFPPAALVALCDLVLVPADSPAPPEPLPPGLNVCQIHRA